MAGTSTPSMYEQLGEAGYAALVARLREKLLADPLTAPYYAHSDMDNVMKHAAEYQSTTLGRLFGPMWGGPETYTGRPIWAVHAPLRVTEPVFDRMVELICGTVAEVGMPPEAVAVFRAELVRYKPIVVTA